MICPVCKNTMIVVERDRIELDHCANCGGTWFDAGELELLLERLGAEDSPRFLVNTLQKREEKTRENPRKCPICLEKMKKIVIGDHSRVLVDVCKRGQGIWFDGGELDDLVKNLSFKPAAGPDHEKKLSEFLGDVFSARHDKKQG